MLGTARERGSSKECGSEHERAVWEKVVVSQKWERSLIAQTCGLLRGFTHPSTYFKALDEGFYFLECGVDLPEHSVEQFTVEMQGLLAVTMNQRLVEKLSYALHDALFEGEMRILTNKEHAAIIAAHTFLQNLYLYGGSTTVMAIVRTHLICDTVLVPHLLHSSKGVIVLKCYYGATISRQSRCENTGTRICVVVSERRAPGHGHPPDAGIAAQDLGHCDVPHAAHAGHVRGESSIPSALMR